MKAANKRNFVSTLIGALLCSASLGANAYQFPSGPPDWSIPFEAGMVCQYAVTWEGWAGRINTREYTDADGNQNLALTGKGHAFRFTNSQNGKTTTQMSQGVQQHIVVYPDGSSKITTTGALLLGMLPTDIPAGPTTVYYNGNTVLTTTAEGVGTLEKAVGHKRDFCAELS